MRKIIGVRFWTGLAIGVFLLTFTISASSQDSKKEGGYTYNLQQLIEEVQKNLKKVDKAIEKSEVEKRNREREAKVREYFEKGNALYQEGKLEEAKKAWQKALDITKDQNMKDYIKANEKKTREEESARRNEEKRLETARKGKARLERERLQKEEQRKSEADEREKDRHELELKQALTKEIDSHCQKAFSYYRDGSFDLAVEEFRKVLELDPQHKSSQDFLTRKIPARIEAEKEAQREVEKRAKLEAETQERVKKQREAEEKQQKLEALQREKEREELARKKEQEQRSLPAEGNEKERQELERGRKFEVEQKEKECPDREESARRLDSLYQQGMAFYESNQFDRARDIFNEILSLDPGYEKAEICLKFNIPNKLKQLELARQYEQERESREKIQSLNKEGKKLYWKKNYDEAMAKFKEVLSLDPKNQDALIYLKLISQK